MNKLLKTEFAGVKTTHLMAGMIQACIYCHPGDSVFKLYPNLRDLGLVISHGYCKKCAARLKTQRNQ